MQTLKHLDVRCSKCKYWIKGKKGIELIRGKCTNKEIIGFLGSDLTFNTNYCHLGVKKDA